MGEGTMDGSSPSCVGVADLLKRRDDCRNPVRPFIPQRVQRRAWRVVSDKLASRLSWSRRRHALGAERRVRREQMLQSHPGARDPAERAEHHGKPRERCSVGPELHRRIHPVAARQAYAEQRASLPPLVDALACDREVIGHGPGRPRSSRLRQQLSFSGARPEATPWSADHPLSPRCAPAPRPPAGCPPRLRGRGHEAQRPPTPTEARAPVRPLRGRRGQTPRRAASPRRSRGGPTLGRRRQRVRERAGLKRRAYLTSYCRSPSYA